jgi:hypothetical protein
VWGGWGYLYNSLYACEPSSHATAIWRAGTSPYPPIGVGPMPGVGVVRKEIPECAGNGTVDVWPVVIVTTVISSPCCTLRSHWI